MHHDISTCRIFYLNFFSSDKPASLHDTLNPDWAPTANMGHSGLVLPAASHASRYLRSKKRRARGQQLQQEETAVVELSSPEKETGVYMQTDLHLSFINAMEVELAQLRAENRALR